MVYRIIIEKGEDFGYVVHCPAIPGCHSQGNTIEKAIENIKDAMKGCLSVLEVIWGRRLYGDRAHIL